MKPIELLRTLGSAAIEEPARYFSGGHNGPYFDPETPVRVRSHWLITLAACYRLTGESAFKDQIVRLANYLNSDDARPGGYSFHHRNKKGKDRCNGLIGQAWSIEALAKASEVLEDPGCASLAEEVFFQHRFDESTGLWHSLEIDGTLLGINPTFNQQLWFAASSLLIPGSRQATIQDIVRRFMDALPENLTVRDDGLIHHTIERLRVSSKRNVLRRFSRSLIDATLDGNDLMLSRRLGKRFVSRNQELINKSIGYHVFNLYAFALLKIHIPEHNFWNSNTIEHAYGYVVGDSYIKEINDNRYGYPYNAPGFQLPFALQVLPELSLSIDSEFFWSWWSKQIIKTYSPGSKMFDRNTPDPTTLTARIYEITRWPIALLDGDE